MAKKKFKGRGFYPAGDAPRQTDLSRAAGLLGVSPTQVKGQTEVRTEVRKRFELFPPVTNRAFLQANAA